MKIAVVCSSNQNRSMETQNILSKKGYDVKSYGTGSVIKLPGAGPNQPNVYEFGTTYEQIYQDLTTKDQQLYQHGLKHLVFTSKAKRVVLGGKVQRVLAVIMDFMRCLSLPGLRATKSPGSAVIGREGRHQ